MSNRDKVAAKVAPQIKQTARDPYAEAMATDPRFTEAPKTGQGVIIGGVKPQRRPAPLPPRLR